MKTESLEAGEVYENAHGWRYRIIEIANGNVEYVVLSPDELRGRKGKSPDESFAVRMQRKIAGVKHETTARRV
jgi:hypothetical protein